MPCSKKWACTLTCKPKTTDWLAGLTFISAVWLLSLSSKKILSISTFSRSCIKVILLPSPSTWLPAEETCCTVGLQKMVWFLKGLMDNNKPLPTLLEQLVGYMCRASPGDSISPLRNRDRPSSFKPSADSGCFLGLYPTGELLRSSVVNEGTLWGPSEPDQQHPLWRRQIHKTQRKLCPSLSGWGHWDSHKALQWQGTTEDENFLWNMDGFWCCWFTHLFSVVLKVRDSDWQTWEVVTIF